MRQVAILGGLLAVSLVATYTTWHAEDTEDMKPGEVEVYRTSGDVDQVTWTSEPTDVTLEHRSDDKGDYIWVTVTERKPVVVPPTPPSPPEAEDAEGSEDAEESEDAEGTENAEDAEDAAPPEPEIETTVSAFRGNNAAEGVFKDMAPLVALRSLSVDADNDAFGFNEPSATIRVTSGGSETELTVGAETFGSRDKYVMVGDKVYLVDDTKLRPLQYGKSRLLERNPQPIGESSATRITVQRGEDVRTFTQQNIEDRAQAMWTLDGQPETEHPVAGAWFGKVFKLRAKSYVAEADIPANLTDIFSYTVSNDEREWTISVKRDEVGDAWYAETDFLRATIELTSSLAADAVVDLDGLFQE